MAFIVIFFALFQELWHLFKNPKYRSLLLWMLIILVIGVLFYHHTEGWSWIDSLYFTVITLATVGYGDLSPTTSESKLFTVFYTLIGLSVFVTFASMLAKERAELFTERRERKMKDDPRPE
jgi:voltage-gated potassium channel Kch